MQKVEFNKAAQKIRNGELIAVERPGDFSVICDAKNDESVQTLRSLENKFYPGSFRVLFDSDARLNRYVFDVPSMAWDILDAQNTDLILILPGGQNLSKFSLNPDRSIAVQMVIEKDEINLVQKVNCPLAIIQIASSQNEFDGLNDLSMVDYVITLPASKNYGKSSKKIPVISLSQDNEVKVIIA